MIEAVDRLKTEIHGPFEFLKVTNHECRVLQREFLVELRQRRGNDKKVVAFYDEISADELKLERRKLHRSSLLSEADDRYKGNLNWTDTSYKCTLLELLTWIVKFGLTEMLHKSTNLLRSFLAVCIVQLNAEFQK